MRTTIGLEESLARANFSGFANHVVVLTRKTSTVTSANKFMSTMERMLIQMDKSGSNVRSVKNGSTLFVKLNMVTKTYLSFQLRMRVLVSSISVMDVEIIEKEVIQVNQSSKVIQPWNLRMTQIILTPFLKMSVMSKIVMLCLPRYPIKILQGQFCLR